MALLFAIALLPMGALTLNAGLKAAALSESRAQQSIAERVAADIGERQKEMTRLRAVTRTLASNPELARSTVERCNAVLGSLAAEFREFTTVALLDARARIVCASNPASTGLQTEAGALIARASELGDVVTGYVRSPRLSSESVLASVAPIGRAGQPNSLYVGATRAVAPILAHRPSDESAFGALADSEGRLLESRGFSEDPRAREMLERALKNGGLTSPGAFRAGAVYAVSAPLGEDGVFLVQGWRSAPASFDAALRAFWALFAPLAIWFVAIAAAWFAVEYYIVRPLTSLEVLARAYARGDSVATPQSLHAAPQEIGSLRRTLAAMAKTLRGREQRLAEALQEERALLREVYHRVNNNLQLVASLLSIQARAAPNEQQALGLERAQERIQLLALAQNRIYASGEVRKEARLDDLCADIARTLTKARGARGDNVELQLHLAPVKATIDQIVPLTFVIGESVAHALDLLEGGDRVPLSIRLKQDGEWVTFEVTSPMQNDRTASTTPAKRIIDAFAGQIGAEMTYDAVDPLSVRVRLRVGCAAVTGVEEGAEA